MYSHAPLAMNARNQYCVVAVMAVRFKTAPGGMGAETSPAVPAYHWTVAPPVAAAVMAVPVPL